MQRRVVGIETEYGVTAASLTTAPSLIDAEHAAHRLFAPLVTSGRTSNLFLRNGGRLYLDVGAHPEYATAECDRLEDLLSQDRAGTTIFADLAKQANAALKDEGIASRIHLFRNNLDSRGNSYGCHENYLLYRRRNFREVADSLIAFFITRQILVGSGHIHRGIPSATYSFSQRAEQMWDAVSSATTRSRPIINTRDEPLADSGLYRRMHVIVGDTNVAEPTTALKIGATELLLAAIDEGLRIDDLALSDPLRAIREINSDLSGTTTVELADGRVITAAHIQKEIHHRVISMLNVDRLDDIHRYVLDLWERGITAITSGDWKGVETELDFAIKKRLLDAYIARTDLPLDHPQVLRLELSYHDITSQGIASKMEQTGLIKRLTTVESVEHAVLAPPATTRAHLRGKLIGAAEDAHTDFSADWVHIRIDGLTHTPLALHDPLAYEDARVDNLIDQIASHHIPVLPA
ncbi:MAG: Pup--protein ligase [Actinobacteria bacterium]|nr:MAG: Pup--protein ligase [Actinomycetota bacterium]